MTECPMTTTAASSWSSNSISQAARQAETQLARALARAAMLNWLRDQVRAGSRLSRQELAEAFLAAVACQVDQERAASSCRAAASQAAQGSELRG